MKNVLKRMGIVATLVGSSYVSGLEAYAQDKPVEAPKPGQKYSVPNDSKVEEEYLPVPPSDSKSVKNSLENKVDKTEPKKERFPYVFIPGKTKDLDEVRIYSDEITQSTKEKREKFLNEIKEKKGISYNFEEGYMSLKPKSDVPEFYKSVKDSAILNMVLEDNNVSSEEKKFIQKHTSHIYESLYRKSEDDSKKTSPKEKSPKIEESSEKSNSHKLFDALFGPIFESWKEARIKQIEREYNENPVDITEGILEAGRIYFENQGKVPKNQSNKK